MRLRILVLPHDSPLACSVMVSLGLEYETIAATCSKSGDWHAALLVSPDLILLDLTALRQHGLHLCHRLREMSSVPIVVLVSDRDRELGITGLEVGADDFVTDLCHPQEAEARLRAVLRRADRYMAHAHVTATD